MSQEGAMLGLLLLAGALQVHLLSGYSLDELLLFEAFVLLIVLLIIWLHEQELARARARYNLTRRVSYEGYHERARAYTELATNELTRTPQYDTWLLGGYRDREGRRLELQECSSESDEEEQQTLHDVATRKKLF